jgi:hypothetical protein
MVFMRKFGVFLLAVILFFSLLGLAFSTSSNIAFTHPEKIKSWLNQSNLYGNFVANAIQEAEKTAGGNQAGVTLLSDTAVQQIAHSTFSAQLLKKDVNSFVDSNYAWLEGNNNKPDFRIDLSSAKQTFAERVGEYVQTYLTSLPVCTDAQLSQIDPQTADPLTLTCRPAAIDPATEAAQVTETIANSGAFLGDPIITASNINPKGDNQTQPYYQSLSGLPKVYQFGTKLPLIAGLIALAAAVGVIFITKRHRNGVRSVGIVLSLAGLVLVTTKFASDQVFNQVHRQIFNAGDAGQVQKALTTFMHHVENQLVKIDLWFGIAYLLLALIILLVLYMTRQRSVTLPELSAAPKPKKSATKPTPAKLTSADTPAIKVNRQPTQAGPTTKPRRRKPPRLVQ